FVTTFSATDLRGVKGHKFAALADETVERFLKRQRQGHLRRPVTAHLDMALRDVLERLLAARVPRVWMVGKRGGCQADDKDKTRILGLFSLTHAMRLVANYLGVSQKE